MVEYGYVTGGRPFGNWKVHLGLIPYVAWLVLTYIATKPKWFIKRYNPKEMFEIHRIVGFWGGYISLVAMFIALIFAVLYLTPWVISNKKEGYYGFFLETNYIPNLYYTAELGLHDPGEAAMWAGLVSGVTPCMVALSAPYWSRKANQLGPRKVMMFILFTLMVTVGACAFTQTPWQLLMLRILQGVVGGYVPIGLAIIILVTPENKVPWAMGLYQASMVMGLVFGPLMGGLVADLLGYRAPFVMFSALTGLCMLGIYLFMPNLQFEHK
ncbi:unnamed protein product, partial [Cylicocyclus nassatus]